MGLFAKAAAKKQSATKSAKKPKKQTLWAVGGNDETAKVAESVHEMALLTAKKKTIDAQMKVHKAVILPFAESRFFNSYADTGVFPETPMKVQTSNGEACTLVVQDRSAQYGVKADQEEALEELLGADAVDDLLYEETRIAFDRDVLAIEGVSEIVEAALERAISKLMREEVLTEEQAGALIDPIVKKTFKPGTLQRLPLICGRNTSKMEEFVDVMGSSCVKYVKA